MDEVTVLMCFLIACAIGIPLVRTQSDATPQVVIVESNQNVREGGSVSFNCIVSNPVTESAFVWTHRNAAGDISAYSRDSSDQRVTVTVMRPTTSTFMITNLFPSDSGLIRCIYTYNTTQTSADRSVCVARQPLLPSCLQQDVEAGLTDTVSLICTAENMCPDDVTLRWFDVDAMTELTGKVTKGTNMTEYRIITSTPDAMTRNYLCRLESTLYPNSRLNCSHLQSPQGVMTTIQSLSSTSDEISTTETPRSNSAKMDENTTFSRMSVIIAACVGGGVMLIIFVIVVFLVVVCKQTCKKYSDDNFQVKFERNNIKIQPENGNANHENVDAHYYSEEPEQEHHQENTSDKHDKVDIPLYAKPDKTKKNEAAAKPALQAATSLNENVGTPNIGAQEKVKAGNDYEDSTRTRLVQMYSTLNEIEKPSYKLVLEKSDSDPYASVKDTDNGDIDRSQIKLPKHESVNEYAYAYTGPKILDPNLDLTDAISENNDVDGAIDDGPHYFVLKKDGHNNVDDIENIIVNEELETTDSEMEDEENKEIQGYKSDKDALIPPRRLHENAADSNFPIEHINTKQQPENGDENHNNLEDHLYSEEKETNEENLVDTDAMPIYAKPDKTKKHVDDGSSISAPHTETSLIEHEQNHYAGVQKNVKVGKDPARRKQPEPWPIVPQPDRTLPEVVKPRHKLALVKTDSDPYARVQDTNDGETDRQKMELPEHESVNQYAYAFTGLRMLDPNLDLTDASSENDDEDKEMDDGPHYFILNKDGQNKMDDTANTKVNDEIYFNESDLEVEENPEIYHKSDKDTLKPMQSIHEDASVGVDGILQN